MLALLGRQGGRVNSGSIDCWDRRQPESVVGLSVGDISGTQASSAAVWASSGLSVGDVGSYWGVQAVALTESIDCALRIGSLSVVGLSVGDIGGAL
jgi:hypothetical protein